MERKQKGVTWRRRLDRSSVFLIDVQPTVQDKTVVPLHDFHPLPNLEYETLNNFKAGRGHLPIRSRPFTRKGHGVVELPEIFLLPIEELDTDGVFSSKAHWYTVLGQRKRLRIPTHSITWTVQEDEDFSKFASVAGPDVTELILHLNLDTQSITAALNLIMNSIRNDWLPALESLIVYVHFTRHVPPETLYRDNNRPPPDWVSNELPEGLDFILLVLAVEVDRSVFSNDLSAFESITSSEAQEDVLRALPLSWIRDTRVKVGEHFNFCIDVFRNFGGGLEDWNEPFEHLLLLALQGRSRSVQ